MKRISNYFRLFAALIVIFMCSFVLPHNAYAVTDEVAYRNDLNKLSVMLNNFSSLQELDEQVREESARTGIDKQEVLSDTIERVQFEQAAMGELVGGATDRSIGIWDGRHNKLRAATAPGDYFVSAGNTTNGLPHGHAGIFVNNDRIVEAVGNGGTAREVARNNTLAQGVSFIYRVNTSQVNRNKVVSRARSYIGRGYNGNPVSPNRNDWGGLNCSQLVWAAYYYGAGIDLALGHPFIAPVTLTMSPVASRYDTIQP